MYLRCHRRRKDGKEHRYWSIMENRRCAGGKVVQRPVLYLGEINDSQKAAWIRAIEVFDEDRGRKAQLALFSSDREIPADVADGIGVRLSEFVLKHPRQWGACRLFTELWKQLGLGEFWSGRPGCSREGTNWEHVLEVLPGNTADKTTLEGFLQKIQNQYGKAERVRVMDRGIPTEEVLLQMRQSDPPVHYLVGTPKGRFVSLEKDLVDQPWEQVREGVEVKLLPMEDELYVLAQSRARVCKERAMRQRQLKKLWKRLTQPEKDHRMLIDLLGLALPAQRPPRITHEKKLADS